MTDARQRAIPLAIVAIWLSSPDVAQTCQELCRANKAIIASYPVQAERYRWKPVRIGGGGFVTGFASDTAGLTRVVRTDVYGAYIWMPGVDRWSQLINSASIPTSDISPNRFDKGVFEIAVAPSDPTRIYLATAGNIYVSRNAGRSFSRSRSWPFPIEFDANSMFRTYGPHISVSPSNPDLAFFGTPHDGLLRTLDGGVSWDRVAAVPAGDDILLGSGIDRSPGVLVWFSPSGEAWALSYGHGMFCSRDDGQSFSALTDGITGNPPGLRRGEFTRDGVFFGVDSQTRSVWKFQYNQWIDLSNKPGLSRQEFVSITPVDDNRIVLFDQGGRGQISEDSGETWHDLPHIAIPGASDPPWLRVSDQPFFALGSVHHDPIVPNRLWAATGMGIFYADLRQPVTGISWVSQTRGIEELVANDVIKPSGQSPLFGAWDSGVHREEDLDRFSSSFGPKERMIIAVQQLDWSADHPEFIVTNASDTRMPCCAEDGDAILAGYSIDGGRTWSKFATLPTPPGTDPSDPWRMSFGTIAVSASNTNNIVWEPSMNRSPFYTMDRGRSWNRVRFEGEVLPFTGSHAELNYQRKTLAADRVLPATFYLVHSGDGSNSRLAGLWRTGDSGKDWTKVFNGEIAPLSGYAAKLRAVPNHAGNLFFTSSVPDAKGNDLMRSTDGGAHWTHVSGVDRVLDIGFGKAEAGASYPTIYLAGYVKGTYGLWRSTDDTGSWSNIGKFPVGSLDRVSVVEGDLDKFGRVYIGFGGSGWVYGDPSTCKPAPFRLGDRDECISVRR